jgi:hypothetical protein
MDTGWIKERRPRAARITRGKDQGARAYFEPDARDAEAWHLYIVGGPHNAAWDIWIDNAQQVNEWLNDPSIGIRFD